MTPTGTPAHAPTAAPTAGGTPQEGPGGWLWGKTKTILGGVRDLLVGLGIVTPIVAAHTVAKVPYNVVKGLGRTVKDTAVDFGKGVKNTAEVAYNSLPIIPGIVSNIRARVAKATGGVAGSGAPAGPAPAGAH